MRRAFRRDRKFRRSDSGPERCQLTPQSWFRACRATLWIVALTFCCLELVIAAESSAGARQPGVERPLELNRPWVGPKGEILPFLNDRDVEDFLLSARVLSVKKIPTGVTKPRKVLLEKDGVRAHAVFRSVDIYKARWNDPSRGPRLNFRDCHIYECAAYRLSRLLGLDSIPPAVVRDIEGTEGSLQIWVENTMMESERRTYKVRPPDPWSWEVQKASMRVFDELIFNDDRNQGNMLIDGNWKLWLIDHTRAFRTFNRLSNPRVLVSCERQLWERLKSLDRTLVEEELEDFLSPREIRTLLRRLEELVERIGHLIESNGEAGVLRDLKPREFLSSAAILNPVP